MSLFAPQLSTEEILCEGLNPQQREIVLADINVALQVMAGAGTGKTEVITRRFAKLANDIFAQSDVSNPTEQIWVSTFTEKAAQEMKTRIGNYVQTTLGIPLSEKAWIGTFHGLCLRILQAHGDKMPHLKEMTLLTEIELDILQEQLVETLLAGELEGLNKVLKAEGVTQCSAPCLAEEALVVLNIDNYELFFTEVVTRVIPRLKASGLSPQAFYQQAQQQAKGFAELLKTLPTADATIGEPWLHHEGFGKGWARHLDAICHSRFSFFPGTWHVELAAEKALRKGKNPPSEADMLRDNLKPIYKTNHYVTYDGRKRKAPFGPPTQDFKAIDDALGLELKLIEVVAVVYALYQQTLRQGRVCDYDDLIQETIRLLESFPDVQARYQTQFKHLMIDEFQDANGAQLQLIQLLSHSVQPCLTVVGDKKQSIYGFRFAEPENLQVLFENMPGYRALTLQTNYRSEVPILNVANRVTTMMDLPATEALEAAKARTEENALKVVWYTPEEADSVASAKTSELEWIVATIYDLIQDEAKRPQEIAILVRDHVKALRLETALEENGIPAIRQRNLGFFDHPIIQQAMALLELVQEPDSDFAWISLLQKKLSHRELWLLAQSRKQVAKELGEKVSYRDVLIRFQNYPLLVSPELTTCLPALYSLEAIIDQFSQAQSHNLEVFIETLFTSFPFISPEQAATRWGQKAQKQLNLLKKMLEVSLQQARTPLDFDGLMLLLKRMQDKNELLLPMEEETLQEDAVRIMTVHGAKGLEFPIVFLAGVDVFRSNRPEGLLTVDPQYPGKLGVGLFLNRFNNEKTLKKLIYDTVWKIPRNLEEELRLFYVAVTRAKNHLYISSWERSFPYLNPQFFQDLIQI